MAPIPLGEGDEYEWGEDSSSGCSVSSRVGGCKYRRGAIYARKIMKMKASAPKRSSPLIDVIDLTSDTEDENAVSLVEGQAREEVREMEMETEGASSLSAPDIAIPSLDDGNPKVANAKDNVVYVVPEFQPSDSDSEISALGVTRQGNSRPVERSPSPGPPHLIPIGAFSPRSSSFSIPMPKISPAISIINISKTNFGVTTTVTTEVEEAEDSFQINLPCSHPRPLANIQDILNAENSLNSPEPQFNATGNRNASHRRKWTRMTSEQLHHLEVAFAENPNPKALERMALQKLTDLPMSKITHWFFTQRKKELQQIKQQGDASNNDESDISHNDKGRGSTPPKTSSFENVVQDSEKPGPSSRLQPPPPIPVLETPEREPETIEQKMDRISQVSIGDLEHALEFSRSKVQMLYMLFTDKQKGMKSTLQKETARLNNQKRSNPFTNRQYERINSWSLDELERFKRQKRRENSTTKRYDEEANAAENFVIKAWLPVIIYAKLQRIPLKDGVKDFTYSTSRESPYSSSYMTPELVKNMEREARQK